MAKKSQCDQCPGLCCRYFALPIDTPEDKGDYDDIRWYLCHKGISVFVEDGDWYINVHNRCKYLSQNGRRCRIYPKRSKICRSYSSINCDYAEGEYDYELHFTNDREMEKYIRIKFDNNAGEKHKANKLKGKGKNRSQKTGVRSQQSKRKK